MSWHTGKRIRSVDKVNGQSIRCYDSGPKFFDRYVVVYVSERLDNRKYQFIGMSSNPFHPQGFGQHGECCCGPHLGRRILFSDLPAECQRAVINDLTEG